MCYDWIINIIVNYDKKCVQGECVIASIPKSNVNSNPKSYVDSVHSIF